MSTNLSKSTEWLATHRATIGGSNAAAAVGLHPYKTPTALYYEMVLGQAEDLESNPDALRGTLLEPIARERLRTVLGIQIIEHDQNDFIRNKKYPFAHCLPDGWIVFEGERIPIELKVPHPRNWRRLDVEVPDYIQAQGVHNAAVCVAPALMLCCLNPVTMEIYRQLYEPSQDAIDALMEAEERFCDQYIIPRIAPPPQTHDDLKLLFPRHIDGKRITATEDIEIAWNELIAVGATAKHAEERKKDLSFVIKNFLEDGETLVSEGGKILATYKSHLETRIDTNKLKADMPEIYRQFASEKPVRTFLVKKPR